MRESRYQSDFNRTFLLFTIIVFYLFIVNSGVFAKSHNPCESSPGTCRLDIPVTKWSFFIKNPDGSLFLDENGLPKRATTEEFTLTKKFTAKTTAFFVIDPWDNAPSDFLNDYYSNIIVEKIVPLISRAAGKKFPIYIFTNKCSAIKPIPYSCSVHKALQNMAHHYPEIKILYWQELNPATFSQELKENNISNLIYIGFASNMCILNRPTGMLNMAQQGFSLYFVPEASAAVETANTWQSGDVHKAATLIISQTFGSIIHFNDLYSSLRESK